MISCYQPVQFSEYTDCTIYRDKWGVPHIHGKTDADVAYGLAWASAEDDFQTMQEQLLAIRGMYGEAIGKKGIVADFAIKFMGIRDFAQEHLDELEDKTILLIDGYARGVNAYALAHRNELLVDDLFPVKRADLVAGYLLGLVEISGAVEDLAKLADGSIVEELGDNTERGSNAIAISGRKTKEGQTFLAINSHQPMEGWYSWYEAHLISDEGMNILGGTFPGGITIFHGTNEHLGWAHTVNQADFSDVYKLSMHPEKEDFYAIDGDYFQLEKQELKSWVKVAGPVNIPITRTIYQSKYGITFKIGEDYFAWRFQAGEAVKAIEQWYKMNKAKSFSEWRSALDIKGIPCTNIVYADKEDNIFYISNAKQPFRSPDFDWLKILPGNTSQTFWTEQSWPIDSLPQVLNPISGYVFNTNNTPYSSSDNLNNPQISRAHATMGLQNPEEENNRSLRFKELITEYDKLSYDEFLRIKFDRNYPTPLRPLPYDEELLLSQSDPESEELKVPVGLLRSWNRNTDPDNKIAPLFLLAKENLRLQYLKNGHVEREDYLNAIQKAADELMTNFNSIQISLGYFQRHRRGNVDLAIGGGADVLAAIYARKDEDDRYKGYSGESYIQMVRFDSVQGPIIESVNAFGASANPGSKHFTDQMPLFVNQQLKKMSLSLDSAKINSIRQYHPLQLSDTK